MNNNSRHAIKRTFSGVVFSGVIHIATAMAYVGTNNGENIADTMRAARVSACDTPMVSLFDSCGSSLVIEDDSIVLNILISFYLSRFFA